MRRRKRSGGRIGNLGAVSLAAFGLVLAAPATAQQVHSWTSDDGTIAFTDDLERVPARYLKQVDTRRMRGLDGYARFTPQDGAAAERYAERLAARLTGLREHTHAPGGMTPQDAPLMAPLLSLRTGGENAPRLELAPGSGSGPVVVEKVFTRPVGKMVTRQSIVVRRGDEVMAVIKPRLREWNVAQDIIDEGELEQ